MSGTFFVDAFAKSSLLSTWTHLTHPPVVLFTLLVALLASSTTYHLLVKPGIPPRIQQEQLQNYAAVQPRNVSRFSIAPYPVVGAMPWDHLPQRVRNHYTMGARVPVVKWFKDSQGKALQLPQAETWTEQSISHLVERAVVRAKNSSAAMYEDPRSSICTYGPRCDEAVFSALEAHPVRGHHVLVVGSQRPWLEAICLGLGATAATTVDFNAPNSTHPLVRTMSVTELDQSEERFDAILSYSSLEHDGLGRYGDPIDPDGDLKRMKKLMGLLRPDGKLYLGVPMGRDYLVYNAHRVYGAVRFPALIQGWQLLGTYGGEKLLDLYRGRFAARKQRPECWGRFACHVQPMHVLSLKAL